MRQIDIKNLKLEIDIPRILNAVSQREEIEIDINADIYLNESSNLNTPIVFKLSMQKMPSSLLETDALLKNIFSDYKPKIHGNSCTLDLLPAWQEIIFLNQPKMLYFDHQTDGVELFEDKELEEYGWHATACDISYREISGFIESNCSGTLVFYDNQIQFNGFVIVDDLVDTRKKVKEFLINKIKENTKDDLIDAQDDDVIEALEYFKIEV